MIFFLFLLHGLHSAQIVAGVGVGIVTYWGPRFLYQNVYWHFIAEETPFTNKLLERLQRNPREPQAQHIRALTKDEIGWRTELSENFLRLPRDYDRELFPLLVKHLATMPLVKQLRRDNENNLQGPGILTKNEFHLLCSRDTELWSLCGLRDCKLGCILFFAEIFSNEDDMKLLHLVERGNLLRQGDEDENAPENILAERYDIRLRLNKFTMLMLNKLGEPSRPLAFSESFVEYMSRIVMIAGVISRENYRLRQGGLTKPWLVNRIVRVLQDSTMRDIYESPACILAMADTLARICGHDDMQKLDKVISQENKRLHTGSSLGWLYTYLNNMNASERQRHDIRWHREMCSNLDKVLDVFSKMNKAFSDQLKNIAQFMVAIYTVDKDRGGPYKIINQDAQDDKITSRFANTSVMHGFFLLYDNYPEFRPEAGIYWRGMNSISEDQFNSFYLAKEFVWPAYVSVSSDEKQARKFTQEDVDTEPLGPPSPNGVLFRVTLPDDAFALKLDEISAFPDEKEVLLYHHSAFIVTAVHRGENSILAGGRGVINLLYVGSSR